MTLDHVAITGNFAPGFQGGLAPGDTTVITNSTISGNSAGFDGGGLLNNVSMLVISNSTISGNTAGRNGGGISNLETLQLTNVTLSGNQAGGDGGGIYNNNSGAPSLNGVTMTNNAAATLSARVRVLGSGRSNKNDANDARAVAVAALRSPSIAAVRAEDHISVLRLLAKAQLDTTHARSRSCSRLHALVRELVAGGIRKEIVVGQADQVLASIVPVSAAQRQRLELAHETLDEIRLLDARLKRSKTRITEAVNASSTTLTEIFGVGPIIAALTIGYTGDIRRFPTPGHYAAYNGTAPVEFSSSGRTVHRLSRRGNRTLNHAIHMIAVTQIRHLNSEGRGYYDRKLAECRTRREAMRSLKRHISDRVFKQLRLDAATR